MIYDYTRLGTVVGLWVLAALFGGLGWGVSWDRVTWLGLIIRLVALVFGAWALLVSFDWISHHSAERIKDLAYARVSAAVQLASALKGLSSGQTDLVALHSQVTIELIAEEAGPLFLVRCIGGNVPFETVEDFLRQSQETSPYLWPVREFGNWRHAQAVTDLIVARGWAEKGTGPYPAKLTRPLRWVAQRFGIEMDSMNV